SLTGESVHLSVLDGHEIVYVHKVDSRHMLGMYSRVGRRAPLHCTAIGKVLMAWESPARRDTILQGCDFKRFREKTITTRADYDVELQRTLDQGFGQDREEFDDHIRCAAIPIFDRLNLAVAGLSVSFPSFRYDVAHEPELVAELRKASRDISRQLGCSTFPLDPPAEKAR
ncbi:MAG: IclR family transcriptional regulator C-terminal domain-containing protein, partial [Rubrivivax sp.]|nr:IclR family transcriptional regulator C-terminal domain-containing protein [Rubrivivax sp.]